MENDEERGVDKGMDESNMESHLVGHGPLSILKVPMPVSKSHQKEGTPEEEVRNGDDEEHLDSGHPLPVDPVQVVLHLDRVSRVRLVVKFDPPNNGVTV